MARILTDRAGTPRRTRGQAPSMDTPDLPAQARDEELLAALSALRAQLDTQAEQLAAAVGTLEGERTRRETLQARCDAAETARAKLEVKLAGAEAESNGLEAQLEGERVAHAATQQRLEQAIAAATKPPVFPPVPAPEKPTAWVVEVTSRDGTGRNRRLEITPKASN